MACIASVIAEFPAFHRSNGNKGKVYVGVGEAGEHETCMMSQMGKLIYFGAETFVV